MRVLALTRSQKLKFKLSTDRLDHRVFEPPQRVAGRPDRQYILNRLMLITAGTVSGFGLLITVPPLVNTTLAADWRWVTPPMVVIVLLSLSALALTGLLRQRRYLTTFHQSLERSREELEAIARENSARLCALLDVTQMMADDSGLESVIDRITETCAEVFDCDHVSLMFNEGNEHLVVRSVGGRLANLKALGAQQKLGVGISGWAAQRREPLLLAQGCNLADYPGLKLNSPTISAAMVAPIVLNDVLVGVLNVNTQSKNVDYGEDEFRALQVFAENVGACIRNAQNHDGMKQTIRELKTILRTTDAKKAALAGAYSGDDD